MKVKEFIKELEKLDPEADVYACDCSYCGGTDGAAVIEKLYRPGETKKITAVFITGDMFAK